MSDTKLGLLIVGFWTIWSFMTAWAALTLTTEQFFAWLVVTVGVIVAFLLGWRA